jgi:hypothetical protein
MRKLFSPAKAARGGGEMNRSEMLLHEMSGTNAKLVASALIEMVPIFKDNPKIATRMTELAQFAFNAHKVVEALSAEVKRLQLTESPTK